MWEENSRANTLIRKRFYSFNSVNLGKQSNQTSNNLAEDRVGHRQRGSLEKLLCELMRQVGVDQIKISSLNTVREQIAILFSI